LGDHRVAQESQLVGSAEASGADEAGFKTHHPLHEPGVQAAFVGGIGGASADDSFPSFNRRAIRAEAVDGWWFSCRFFQSMFGPNTFESPVVGVGSSLAMAFSKFCG
jgi:hypothetical protein